MDVSVQAQVHCEQTRVRSYEADPRRRATPLCLVNGCQEAAAIHAGKLGVGMEWMLDAGLAWVLTYLELDIASYPPAHEVMQVHTWPVGANKYYAFRYFHLQAADGRDLARGRSCWAVLDMQKRALASMPGVVRSIAPPDDAPGEPFRPPRLRGVGDAADAVGCSREFRVRRADLDMNGHVNNAVFAQWALESVPDSQWDAGEPARLEMAFRAEALYGEAVRAACVPQDSDGASRFAHELARAGDGTVLATARTAWRATDGGE